jgi:hypothetical protein
MAASDTVGMVGQIGGAIPYVGPLISLGTSLASGFMKKGEAEDQAKRAEELRKKSANLQKGMLRPEYTKALRADQMAALYGLPGYNTYLENIDEGVANNARSIAESSPNGAATLAALSATLNNANAAKESLFLKDSLAQEQKMAKANQTLWNTGDKQMDLVGMQRADKRDLNQGAMNLENAATANKIGSIDQILASIGVAGNMVGKNLMGDGGAGVAKTGAGDTTLPDGTTVSAETIAAIQALMSKNSGSALPKSYSFQP